MKEYSYPTTKKLDNIALLANEVQTPEITESLIKIIHNTWWMPDYGFRFHNKKLELHTGGWSGNESIIASIKNSIFWRLFWKKSTRGGHYYFEITIL